VAVEEALAAVVAVAAAVAGKTLQKLISSFEI
jgi:hypothetical protein